MKRVKILFLSIFGFLLIGFITAFLLRNQILNYALNKASEKFKTKYSLLLKIESAQFKSLTSIQCIGISAIQTNAIDTLVSIDTLSVRPNYSNLFQGLFSANEIKLNALKINIINKNGGSNYNLLFKNEKTKSDTLFSWKNIIDGKRKLLSRLFPQEINIKHAFIKIAHDKLNEDFNFNNITRREGVIAAELKIKNTLFSFKGSSNNSFTENKYKLYNLNKTQVPIIDSLFGFECLFDSLSAQWNQTESNDVLNFGGGASLFGFTMKHQRIADTALVFKPLEFLFDLKIEDNRIYLDSNSLMRHYKLEINPYLSYSKTDSKQLDFSIRANNVNVNDYIQSFPRGLFNKVDKLEVEGLFDYKMYFSVNNKNIDSLKFYSSVKTKDFKVLDYKNSGINNITNDFAHDIYEKGNYVRSIQVSPLNPNYYAFSAIAPNIRNAIHTSEDGAFFWHKGFNEEAIRKSIAENIKTRKFKRGGSTISMQFVKNVYLSRQKTLSRKIEEILIVWLIENQRIVTKERMFEIYLNIIEFGPDVYGIGEASKFYFNKTPFDLSLNEAMLLSNIMPRPKWFMYCFEKNGDLKPYVMEYMHFLAGKMKAKNLITENEMNDLKPQLKLSKQAASLLKRDTTLIIPELFDESN